MALRATFWMAAGVIIGFVLGGVPARRQASALRVERDALQAKLEAGGSSNMLQALLPHMDLGPNDDAPPSESAKPQPAQAPAQPPAQPNPQTPAPSGRDRDAEPARDAERNGAGTLEQFDQFALAQRARTAAARAALVEQAGLDAAQLARLDQSLLRMNEALRDHAEEVVAVIATRKEPTPMQMLGIGHDLSGVLYDGQRELEAVVGEAAPSVDRSALQIWNYVDVQSWQPLVRDKLAAIANGRSATGAAGSTAAPRE